MRLLLKLPPENGLRRLARNLSKFPRRVIYSLIPASLFNPNDQRGCFVDSSFLVKICLVSYVLIPLLSIVTLMCNW